MSPRETSRRGHELLLSRICDVGESAPPVPEKLHMMELVRSGGPELGDLLDRQLLVQQQELAGAFHELKHMQEQLRARIEELTSPPWHPAVFLGREEIGGVAAAVVWNGHGRRAVRVEEGVDLDALAIGDRVYLSDRLNVLLAPARGAPAEGGETAAFRRWAPGGRVVLESRDEEVVALASGELAAARLAPGDLVRWDRNLWLASEKVARPEGEELFLEETPSETFADIGGLVDQKAALVRALMLHREHPELARRYGLARLRGILLAGPPGNGKTMLGRALANHLAGLSASGRCRFMYIKPARLTSMWYGKAEEHYREAFRAARRAGEGDPDVPAVMFFEEVDACGAVRGASLSQVNDRVLAAFLAELDGLTDRGNVLVIGATNRADALDPALLRPGRLGDCILEVPRPDRLAAREILERHLAPQVPLAGAARQDDGGEPGGGARRRDVLDAALARIYAPNSLGVVLRLRFRDGSREEVHAHRLISGAGLARIVREATERACVRELEGGEPGLAEEDLLAAVDDEIARAVGVLTPVNCRRHLDRLPQDVDVVTVEPVRRTLTRPYRVLAVA